jgi:hypothetical protein
MRKKSKKERWKGNKREGRTEERKERKNIKGKREEGSEEID